MFFLQIYLMREWCTFALLKWCDMNLPATTIQNINDFFEIYARSLEHHDTKAMAYMYNIPCTMLSDDTTNFYNDYSKLEGLFNQGVTFYRQFGIAHIHAEISKKVIKAKVNWQYRDTTGNLVYACDYQYVLKLDKNNKWRILLSVSVNEKERMEEAMKSGLIAQHAH